MLNLDTEHCMDGAISWNTEPSESVLDDVAEGICLQHVVLLHDYRGNSRYSFKVNKSESNKLMLS